MAIRMLAVKCPNCGASLDIEEGRKQMYCSYCGAKVIVDNDNEYIYRSIDEAEIKRAEVEENVQLKKLEILEKKRQSLEKSKKARMICTILMVIVTLLLFVIGFSDESRSGFGMAGLASSCILLYMWLGNAMSSEHENDDGIDFSDKVKIPNGISDYEGKNYVVIESIFTNAGFTNVKCIPLNDLTTGLLKKPGMVESITVNGNTVEGGGKKVSPNAAVIISYHSF